MPHGKLEGNNICLKFNAKKDLKSDILFGTLVPYPEILKNMRHSLLLFATSEATKTILFIHFIYQEHIFNLN